MNNKILYKPAFRNVLFWLLNILFWGFLILKEYIGYIHYIKNDEYNFYLVAITFVLGFLMTVSLRYLFKHLLSRIQGMLVLSIVLFLTLVCFSGIWKMLDVYISQFFWPQAELENFRKLTLMDHLMDTFMYLLYMLVWGGVYFVFFLWSRVVVQSMKVQEAENLASRARFSMLQNQLNPHFLFNAMNSIRALIFENQQKASDLVTELSDFLKYNLRYSDSFFVTLDSEIEAIGNYLAIEKKRFEADLQFEVNVEAGCEKSRVIPNLLLPIVDNAVKYGMLTSPVPLKVLISAFKVNDHLHLEVFNTGHWVEGSTGSAGKGILNVTERLDNIFTEKYFFNIHKDTDFVKVIIEIPEKDETSISVNHH